MGSDIHLDSALVARIEQGDQQALGAFVDLHQRSALALAFRVLQESGEAEEVLQEAFLAVWRRAASYRPEAGSARSWFLKIVQNRAIDRLRARRRDAKSVPIDDRITVGDEEGVFPIVSTMIDRHDVREALAGLPEEQRETIELAYFAGYSCREIGEMTGAPVGTVKSRMRLALVRLRQVLGPRISEALG